MTTSFSDDEMLMNGRRVELGGARGTTYPHVQPTNAGCTRKTTFNFENANLGNKAEWGAQSANEASLGPKGASFALWAPHSAFLSRSNKKQHTLQMYRALVESLRDTRINGTAVRILPEMVSSDKWCTFVHLLWALP